MAFAERLKNAFDVFRGRDPTYYQRYDYGVSVNRPHSITYSRRELQTIVNSIFNRIAVDCSLANINQVKIDSKNDRYVETTKSKLNYALSKSANIDQTGRELIREAVTCMLKDGCVAIVPTYTTKDPELTDAYDIYELRAGKVKEWRTRNVIVELYNEKTGRTKDYELSKSFVCLIENPFYDTMNAPNSVGQRLKRVLDQLEKTNAESSMNKLDLIIQLPYMIKSDAKRQQAEQRRKDIEAQLTSSALGVAYTDGTERIVQLNRSLENNLWTQAKELTSELYNQLGLCRAIFDGTADEQTMLNYTNQTLEPILTALVEEMERKWLSQTARTQGQAIRFFIDPFRLIPINQLAEMADKLTRNEIMTSNEIRAVMRMRPVDDPRADELRNSNLNHPEDSSNDKGISKTDEDVEFQNQQEKEG